MPTLTTIAIMSLIPTTAFAAPRECLNFNPGWKLYIGDPDGAASTEFNDAEWEEVTLPHAWNEDDAFRQDIRDLRTGIAWYRKHFTLPASAEGRQVFIEFEGVRQAGEVWLNGEHIGMHENGVMAFGFDLTGLIKPAPAENVLAVRTDNDWAYRERLSGARFQWSDRNFNANYGGIPKNVRLHITDDVYQTLPLYSHLGTTGVYIYATDFDIPGAAATIHAESEVRNAGRDARTFTYGVTVENMVGDIVAQFDSGPFTVPGRGCITVSAAARAEDLEFWSWGYGYLYTVRTALMSEGEPFDTVTTRTGFRKTEFGDGVVKLNDRVILLKGYAQRTSNEWPAVGMSVPPWLSDYSNGLMVESNANLVRWMHVTPWRQDVESCDRVGLMQMLPAGDSERDAFGRIWAARLELMRDAIIYNRNSPSVLVYESGNENICEQHMQEMKALRDRYDPHGGRAIGSREMLGSTVAEYGGEMLYINKSAGKPLWATEYSRDEGLRKYWDDYSPPYHKNGDGPLYRNEPAPAYNHNQDSHAIENIVRWYDFWRERPGTGRRVSSGGLNIIFSDTNTHHRGAENYRRSGEVDPMRIPKDGFFTHKVIWDGWVDAAQPAAHIFGQWNYKEGVVKNVYVVSTADDVELLVNSRSLGRGERSYHFLFTFNDVAWEPGEVTAVGYDNGGREVCRANHSTAGEPASIKLSALTAPTGFRADGADLALIQFEVVDAEGQRCPTALNTVDFKLSGPAEWRGGIAQGPGNRVLDTSLPVECGVNRVLIRSTTEPGAVRLTATADGLPSASIELTSVPFEQQDGWSRSFPSDSLPSRLDFGPTPKGSSVRPTRRPIEIARVEAGDGEHPEQAIDDDETTLWSGRNPIKFTFARSAAPHELVLKVGDFRRRSYPIRVDVDGTEVFRGTTERSLGYVTIPLQPVTGKTLTITPIGQAEADEAFTQVVELDKEANASGDDNNVRPELLRLAEVEVYEPIEE